MTDDLVLRLQQSIERRRRLAELELHAREVVARGERAPRKGSLPSVDANQLWVPPGASARVHGLAIGDLVYVGSGLRALDRHDVEPSLIDPEQPVDLLHPDATGEEVAYWSISFAAFPADSRAGYLHWLAGGRRDALASPNYVELFLYGLERRVYEYAKKRGSSAEEMVAIGRELVRLLTIYGEHHYRVASPAHELLDLIQFIEPRARAIRRPQSAVNSRASMRLRIALGECALAGEPLPAKLAYQWLRAMHYPSTPAQRCGREFELLFHIRYAQRFGDGMVVKPNKRHIALDYAPSNPGLAPLSLKTRELPDLVQLAAPLARLVELSDDCTSALGAYSRSVLKHGRDSLASFAMLPDELVEATHSADATAIADLIRSRMSADGLAHVAADEVLQYVRIAKPEKIAKAEAMLLAQGLEKLGCAIEPDVRLGGPSFELGQPAIIFRRLPDCPSTASEEYETATLCMRLGAVVSAADDEVSEAERTLLRKHIEETLQLSPGERQRLGAHLAWLLDAKPGMNGLKKRLAALSAGARHHIGRLLILVATIDGQVDPREMKMLEKLYALIGLDTGALYADIHAALATDDDVVTVATPAASKGFAVPPKPATTTSGVDMERVRLKIAETRQVSSLLSTIFDEDEPPPAVAPAAAQAQTIGTLDVAHSELLRRLARRDSWPRTELERLAGELSLMTDGALETINDYAYATANEALWEDEDPVAINPNVARELIA